MRKAFLPRSLLAPALALAAGGRGEPRSTGRRSTSRRGVPAAGARLFVNYCLGCHSAQYMRYNRLTDLGLTEEQIKDNLMFTADKVGDTMTIAMTSRRTAPSGSACAARSLGDRALARRRLALHVPAHLLPRRQDAARLEQPGVPERRHAAPLWSCRAR
jgi:cytochrome c1